MSRPTRYKTAQSKAILEYLSSLGGAHVTAAQIAEYFGKTKSVGLTTVYRHLDRLTGSGIVRKYFVGDDSSACYQYIADCADCAEHFHLKCEGCGTLVHLRCDMLDGILEHVHEEHSFLIDRTKVIFYGKCADCLKKDSDG